MEALNRQALEENQLGYFVKIFNLRIKIVKEKKNNLKNVSELVKNDRD